MQKNQFGQTIGDKVSNWATCQLPNVKEIRGNFFVLKALDLREHALQLFNAFSQSGDEIYTYLPCGPFNNYGEFEDAIKKQVRTKCFLPLLTIKLINHSELQAIGM